MNTLFSHASRLFYVLMTLTSSLAEASEIRYSMADFEEYCESETLLESAKKTLKIIRAGRSCTDTFVALSTSSSYLDLSGKGIKDLTPLKFFHRVSRLNLSQNQIEDLTPLKGFNRLRELDVSSNQIFSLQPLSEISSLEKLNADHNNVEQIADFRNDSIEELSLNDNLLILGGVNFSVAKFPRLKTIELRQNGLRVFSFFLGDLSDRRDLSNEIDLAVDLKENELTAEEQDFLRESLPNCDLGLGPPLSDFPSCLVCMPIVVNSLESDHVSTSDQSKRIEFIGYVQGKEIDDIEKRYVGDLVALDSERDLSVRERIEELRTTVELERYKESATVTSILRLRSEIDILRNRLTTLSSEPGALLSTENLNRLFRREVRKHIVKASSLGLESSKVLTLLYSRSESLKIDHNRLRSLDQLKDFQNLRFVDLSANIIQSALALREMPFLERIDLSGNVLGASFLQGGASDGLGSDSLWDLRLVKNGIDETSFDFNLLNEMKALQSIDLRENDFHPEDLMAMREENPHLNWAPQGSVTLADPILVENLKSKDAPKPKAGEASPAIQNPLKNEKDKDGDGFSDAIDLCDETPENVVNNPTLKAKINKNGPLIGCYPNGDKITN